MNRPQGRWIPPVRAYDDDEQDDLLTALDTRDALIGWAVFGVLALTFYGALTYTRNHLRNR